DPLEQEGEMLRGVAQTHDVRQVAADLDGEEEVRRRLLDPACDRARTRQPVEGVVQLDGVEVLRVEAQPLARSEPRRIEDAVSPVGVVPPATANPYSVRQLGN